MYNLKDYIVVLKNIVPDELCDVILAEYKNADDWAKAHTGSGVQKKIRNCDTIELSQGFTIKDSKERAKVDAEIFVGAARCIEPYRCKD